MTQTLNTVTSITTEQLNTWLQAGDAILIDVREPAEFSEWHIPHAVSIPLANIDRHIMSLQDEPRKLVFQCLKGTRGNMASNRALAVLPHHHEVYNLTGGIEAWQKADLPLIREQETTGSTAIPIMRQVLIAAGVLIVLGSVLALLGVSLGTYLTLFVGAGLTFAGVTGFCGMAMLLAKMPWNK